MLGASCVSVSNGDGLRMSQTVGAQTTNYTWGPSAGAQGRLHATAAASDTISAPWATISRLGRVLSDASQHGPPMVFCVTLKLLTHPAQEAQAPGNSE